MKTFYKESLKIIMYTIFGILLVMSSYIIIFNIYHVHSLSETTIVSEMDKDYKIYQDNIRLIEESINKHTIKDNKLYLSLTKVLNSMKINKLIPKTKLNNKDLYDLNDYFMEKLINDSWVSTLKEYEFSNKYQEEIKELVDNSNYLNNILTSNSLISYDSKTNNIVGDNYHFVLTNYMMYSKVILNICNELGGGNE